MPLNTAQRRQLLALARSSIDSALGRGEFVEPPLAALPVDLMTLQSSFVTLRIERELRGCCGTLESTRSLAEDVWRNAWASAFRDPRFLPLTPEEWSQSDIHVSVLTSAQPMRVANEEDLLSQLRPRVDGLILELGASRATFLPAVWEQIRDPVQFVRELKFKAGWPADFWSPQIRVSTYRSESFGEEEAEG
ncbi:MAG: AmmeMemoRadiSam system protein A [Steroidobacter sp.]